MITYADELLKQNAPLVFIDYAHSQLTKLQDKIYRLESELLRETDEEKKSSLTNQIELLQKDVEFFRGEKQVDDGWKLVGNEPVSEKKDEDYDFEKEMDELMAKKNTDYQEV